MAAAGSSFIMEQNDNDIRLFLSWSGKKSSRLASIFKTYVTDIFPDSDIYYSSDDIRGGEKWRSSIESGLNDRNFSIIFLTESNLQSKWIYFEAGALSKSMTVAKIQPFLYDLKVGSISEPLSSYQARELDKDNILKTIYDINNLNRNPIDRSILDRNFKRLWPEMEKDLAEVSSISDDYDSDHPEITDAPMLNQDEQISEILRLVRSSQKDVSDTSANIMNSKFINTEPEDNSLSSIRILVENIYNSLDKEKLPKNKEIFLDALSQFIHNSQSKNLSKKEMRKGINNLASKYAVKLSLVVSIIDQYWYPMLPLDEEA